MLANIKSWQTDLKTGLIIPGSIFEDHNTIQNDIRYYLAYKIGTDTTDQAMDDLFTTDGTPSASNNDEDGIAHGTASNNLTEILATSLSIGGDNTTTYIEFYGYIDSGGSTLSLTDNLYLGFDYNHTPPGEFIKTYASYDINTSVSAGRRFHFYWRVTIS